MTDVLIAGAGPVGLFLAYQLAAAGRSVRLVEMRAAQSEHSKALAVMPRTMEAFRIAGIAQPFENVAHRITRASVRIGQTEAGQIALEAPASWYDYIAVIPQNLTEKILYDAFVAKGGTVEYGTTLEGLIDGPDGVAVRLRSASGEERANARYVVGCDGAHSTVRALLGFGFEGAAYDQTYALFDVDVVGESPESEFTFCLSAAGPLAIFPLGRLRRRVVTTLPEGFSGEATLDLANEMIGERGPWNVGATKLHWGSVFHIAHRQTPGMHKGSIFLAGDASHVHSPFGGQGMNAGLGDAANLAWKLDYALAGFGTGDLLRSYSLERHAVARALIRATDRGTKLIATRNPLVRTLRDWWLPGLLGSKRFVAAFNARISGLDVRYEGSPIVAGQGRRAPDKRVVSGERERRLYDALAGRYLLVVPPSVDANAIAAYENFARHYGGAVLVTSSDEAGTPLVRLVRPDGYLALETTASHDPTPALEALARVLATHVRRTARRPA